MRIHCVVRGHFERVDHTLAAPAIKQVTLYIRDFILLALYKIQCIIRFYRPSKLSDPTQGKLKKIILHKVINWKKPWKKQFKEKSTFLDWLDVQLEPEV